MWPIDFSIKYWVAAGYDNGLWTWEWKTYPLVKEKKKENEKKKDNLYKLNN